MYKEAEYEAFADKMEKTFPKMFSYPYGGFAVGTGWWVIIEDLCRNIQSHVDWKQEQKEKYERGDGCEQVSVLQIKEKFGGLRFYYVGGDEQVHGMVRMAEAWASNTCEVCGNQGTTQSSHGYVSTRCTQHKLS